MRADYGTEQPTTIFQKINILIEILLRPHRLDLGLHSVQTAFLTNF